MSNYIFCLFLANLYEFWRLLIDCSVFKILKSPLKRQKYDLSSFFKNIFIIHVWLRFEILWLYYCSHSGNSVSVQNKWKTKQKTAKKTKIQNKTIKINFFLHFCCKKMDVSRSGRIRKKSSKLADFESPDEIDDVNPTNKKKRRLSNQVRSFLTSFVYDF